MSALQRLFGGELPRLVMFDLDGTLVDSVPDLAAAVDQVLALRGRPAAGVAKVKNWVGNGALVLVRRALAGSIDHAQVDEAEAQAALADFMQAYSGGHAATTVYAGVPELLGWLRERGVLLSVITNKPERFVAPLLKEKGLGEFDWIIGGDTLPVKKPDPAGLLRVMSAGGVTAQQSLFVGDSRNDVLAARAADVRVVAVSYGYNHGRPVALENPDLLVDSLDALI
ncbi:phosphoglycolate phosphatase [Halopseudomonas litoralis]|uniref:Phosphoglycolate phosphatase n=1 Tax=Halopseudomonas litoralis TaxID=797277 RepID=A0A1H1V5N6_9GAMM|nr:phosphoglycolate phosphatase [Halopseudomonas litoralis]SDS79599.1 phosphoglycolate phosphatase [Halopseudomonas litoralis]